MLNIGQFNRLTVVDEFPFGFYLNTSTQGKADTSVLLPSTSAPCTCNLGDQLDVFVYHDNDNRLVASLVAPKAQLGELALLTVKHVTQVGAFLDWGLEKDLLVPVSQQDKPMDQGLAYLVYIYQEQDTGRLAGSSKLHRFLSETPDGFHERQAVDLWVYARTPMGFKAVVDNRALGLVFKDEAIKPLKIGQKVPGFVKRVRDDGKLDLCFQFHDEQSRVSLAEQILDDLEAHGGISTLTDKSPAEEISPAIPRQ